MRLVAVAAAVVEGAVVEQEDGGGNGGGVGPNGRLEQRRLLGRRCFCLESFLQSWTAVGPTHFDFCDDDAFLQIIM